MEQYWLTFRGKPGEYKEVDRKKKIPEECKEFLEEAGVGIIYSSCEYFDKNSVECKLPENKREMTAEDVISGECSCSDCSVGIYMYHNKF